MSASTKQYLDLDGLNALWDKLRNLEPFHTNAAGSADGWAKLCTLTCPDVMTRPIAINLLCGNATISTAEILITRSGSSATPTVASFMHCIRSSQVTVTTNVGYTLANGVFTFWKKRGAAANSISVHVSCPAEYSPNFTFFDNATSDSSTEPTGITYATEVFDTIGKKTAYNAKGSATKVAQITTNEAGQVTNIAEVEISGVTPASHTHGNVTNDGKLQASDVAIANGDKLVITDASASGQVARASTSFDGNTVNKALTPKGTFENFAKQADIDTAIENIPTISLVGDNHVTVTSDDTTGTVTIATDIQSQTSYTAKGTATKVPQITTNSLGQVTGITEVGITAVRYDTNSQGLTDTQKSNARTNIGAGTSSLVIGTTATTAAAGNHAHGNITNDGKIDSTADLAVVTGTSGAVTTANLSTSSPSASGTTTSFIDTVSQNSTGKITATKKTITSASTSAQGIVQLAGSIGTTVSSENNKAASEKAVRDAINALDVSDITANLGVGKTITALSESDGKISATASNIQITESQVTNLTTDLGNKEDKSNKVSSWSSTTNNTRYPGEKLVKDSLDAKENSSNKVTSWQSTPDNTHYPSEKLVKDALDGKVPSTTLSVSVPANSTKYVKMTVSSAMHHYLVFFNASMGVLHAEWLFRTYGDGGRQRTEVSYIGAPVTLRKWYGGSSSGLDYYIEFNNDSSGEQYLYFSVCSLDRSALPSLSTVNAVPDSYQDLPIHGTLAEQLRVSRKLAVNLANTSTDTTFNGTADQTGIKVSGTLGIANGGTGKTTAKAAVNALLGSLPAESLDNMADNTPVVMKYFTPTDSNGALYTRTGSHVWTYIKGKMSSDTGVNISGNAASADKADKITTSAKIGDTNKPVYVAADGTVTPISYTISKSVPSDAVFTDTKVTSVSNHYEPAEDSTKAIDAGSGTATQLPTAASGGTRVNVVTGLKRDAKGHVVGVTSKDLWSPNNTYTVNNAALKLQINGGTATSKFTANASTDATITFATGSSNGTIAVDGTNVAVKGLGSAAYTASTDYTPAAHASNTSNPHSVTKSQVGLGSVVNTGDSATPVENGTTKFTTGGAYTELAKKVNVANVNLDSQTTTLLALTQELNANNIHYRRWYTTSIASSANISDRPVNSGFMVEAKRVSYSSGTDWSYILTAWSHAQDRPYFAWVKNDTTALSWKPLDSHWTTHLYAGSGTAANAETTNGNTKITVTDESTVRNSVTLTGTNGVSVASNSSGTVTITGTKVESSSTNGNIKINGTETTVYTHPTTAGSKHVPSGGSSGNFLKYSAAGTAAWSNIAASDINSGQVAVANGGTGASDASGARTNLSVYSKSEVDSMLGGRIEIVASLPSTGSPGVIYYVGPSGSGGDKYDEYIWDSTTSAFVKVGEHSVDLSDYVNTLSTSGSGSFVTGLSKSGNTLTLSKGDVTNVYMGQGYTTCASGASDTAKTASLTNYVLKTGGIVTVKFTNAVPANSTLNINSKGAKAIYNKGAAIAAGVIGAGDTATFIYDGTQYHLVATDRASSNPIVNITRNGTTFTATRLDGTTFTFTQQDNNTTYTEATLGQGYGTCTTAQATAAKVVTLSDYALATGGLVAVKFSYALCASATMNINSKGAKSIFVKGAAVTDSTKNVVQDGDIAYFIYDGTQYQFLGTDRAAKNSITGLTVNGTTVTYTRADGTTGTITTKDTTYVTDGTYDSSTNKVATQSTVTNAINALDVSAITGAASKTITSISETNGKVSATYSNISITKSQVSDFPSSMTPTSHAHGNIANGGTLTDTAAAAAGNDYVVIRDADNSKIQTSTIKGTEVADAVSKKHSHSTLTLSTTAQAYDGTHTLALPSTDPYTSARTPASHTHGNITNAGALQTTDVAIASGDKLIITDSSDSNKVARTSTAFDGSTTTTALTPKGTFESFQAPLAAQTAYTSKGTATKVPQVTTNALGQVTGITEVTISGVTPASHASSATTYGVGTTSNYGHVKLATGDMNGATHADGVAVSKNHTHSQYQTVLAALTSEDAIDIWNSI